jgi:hypothetical protein
MHALLAVGTSIVVGLVTIRPGDYRYWRYWAGRTFGLASAGLILSYGLAGLAGFVVLDAVEPSGGSMGAAVIEGFAGHAVFRARIDLGGVGDEPVGESLLGLVRGWLLEWLSGDTRTAVRSRLAKLNDHALVELAFDIFWENTYGADPSMRAVAVEQHDSLKSASARLTGPESIDARASLRGFCLAEIQRHRLVLVT